MKLSRLSLTALLLLASCRKDAAPPAPSAEQANQLDDAEAMLNDLDAKENGPADRSTGPSNVSD